MQLPDIKGLINLSKTVVMANRPEILLGTAIAGTVGAVLLAAKGGYDSGKFIAHVETENAANGSPPPTKVEIIQLTWQNYVPAALATAGSLSATGGLHWIHVREKKALVATGLAAVEEARAEVKAYVEDLQTSVDENTTGKTKEKIHNSLNEKQADRHDGKLQVWSDGEVTEMYLVRDGKSGRDIWSNQQMIEEAINEVNRQLISDGEVSLNTFYSNAGFNELEDGEEYGWNGGDSLTLQWTSNVRDDGRPVKEFRFRDTPEKGYDRKTR